MVVVALVVAVVVHFERRQPVGSMSPMSPTAQQPAATPTAPPGPRSPSPSSSPGPSSSRDGSGFYAGMTPYSPPDAPSAAPNGFVPVFVEHVGRHGSRTLTSTDATEAALRLWRRAEREGALTRLGRRLGPAVERIDEATRDIGPGNLTTLGTAEEHAIGRREAERLTPLFADAASSAGKVAIVTSGRQRTVASAKSFVRGLRDIVPGVPVGKPDVDTRLLRFHVTDHEYADFLEDGPWQRPYEASVRPVHLDRVSQDLLERLYAPAFVRSVDDPEAEAENLYEVYRAAPALARDVQVDLTPFVPRTAAAAFAFADDARSYYSRGPGVAGDDRSYRPAQVLLDDFFAAADRRLDGGSTVAVYRFAHAEELAPFASLLQLPGTEPLARRDQLFRWEDSGFRTERVIPLGSNISWTVWRDPANRVLVSVLSDERPTSLGRGCRGERGLTGYYRLNELKRCLPGG